MPVVQFHLVTEHYPQEALSGLLKEASQFLATAMYPDVTPTPVERVRAIIHNALEDHWATGGVIVTDGGVPAPYFSCISMVGRPQEQLETMMRGMTQIVVRWLGCPQSLIRGRLIPVDPGHWFIAGEPASQMRGAEISKRNQG